MSELWTSDEVKAAAWVFYQRGLDDGQTRCMSGVEDWGFMSRWGAFDAIADDYLAAMRVAHEAASHSEQWEARIHELEQEVERLKIELQQTQDEL